ncbi:MAG: hypothetical protein IPN76_10790 [Saprospiraceae bacterium]|nr:hypothetical protein [Saprospiraceae bacterium]
MKSSSLICLLFHSFLLVGKAQTTEWIPVLTEAYSIEFPAEPVGELQNLESGIGPLVLDIKMYEVVDIEKDDNYVYGILSTKYPVGTIDIRNPENLKQVLDSSTKGTLDNSGGKLLTERDIELGGYAGKELRIELKDGVAVLIQRSYLTVDRMLVVQIICDPSKEGNAASKRFFDSFQIKV